MKISPAKAPVKAKVQSSRAKVSTANIAPASTSDAADVSGSAVVSKVLVSKVDQNKAQPWRSGARRRILPETRAEMLERLTNPQISLHEAGVILRVCSATVRHYSNAGYLPHLRTPGGQRRFYLKEVLAFLRARDAEKKRQ